MSDLQPLPALELERRIRVACDQFEQQWKSGSKPRIEEFLRLFAPAEQMAALEHISQLQQSLILQDLNARTSQSLQPIASSQADQMEPDATLLLAPTEARDNESDENSRSAVVQFDVVEGPHSGVSFKFDRHDTLIVGRSSKSQLKLVKDLHFSRHHFRLEVNPPNCFIMDLSSRNGTFVNGTRIREKFLHDGDVVSGGRTKMIVSVINPIEARPESSEERNPIGGPNRQSAAKTHRKPADDLETHEFNSDAPLISGYEIFEQIGAGDLGIVYRAERLSDGKYCALKVMTPISYSDEAAVRAFLREGTILRQLDHPSIIRLMEMGFSGDNVFVATEYVKNIHWNALASHFSPAKTISVACRLMMQILAALEFAHSKQMVHRDVKPGNILITKTQNGLKAKLADFGLAKHYSNAGLSQVTREGAVLGSLAFMSPDQFLNSRESRPACDIYSAGATLYWMLTGQEPIRLEGHPCKFLAILEDEPTPIQMHNPRIPEDLAAIVHKSLEKLPEKRWASAAKMRDRLKRFLAE